MILLAAALLAVVCTPLPTCGDPGAPVAGCASPTPVIRWSAPIGLEPVTGYYVRWQRPDTPMDDQRKWTVTCAQYEEDGPVLCPGVDFGFPVQRFNGSELEFIEYTVSAFNDAGEGPQTERLPICMSSICKFPGPCN